MITQMLEQFSNKMGGRRRRRIDIFSSSKISSSPHLKLFRLSRPKKVLQQRGALKMDEFHERGNQSLGGSLKRASLRLSCPKERLLTRERILCIRIFGSCRNRHIFTLFGMQPVQERRSTGSLRDDAKLSPEKYFSCLGDRLQEILELS